MAKQAKNTAKSSQSTLVTFLLDRSSSMMSVKAGTIEAFNAYLGGLQKDAVGINFSLVQFDTEGLEKVHVNIPVADARKLTDEGYRPRGGTPLIDAAYKVIKAVEASEAGKSGAKIVICIQTDGEENSSKEYTWEALKTLINEKTKLGWQFNFMGCGIDAYDQGQKMGIAAVNTMSYDRNSEVKTKAAFAASASNTRAFASGLAANTSYSMGQRSAAGDAFAHKARGLQGVQGLQGVHGKRWDVATDAFSLDVTTPPKVAEQVDDFTL
jgi:uncharacterized protein YegL